MKLPDGKGVGACNIPYRFEMRQNDSYEKYRVYPLHERILLASKYLDCYNIYNIII